MEDKIQDQQNIVKQSQILSSSKVSMFDENVGLRSLDNSAGTVRVEDCNEENSTDAEVKFKVEDEP
jgi:hypothetical protein